MKTSVVLSAYNGEKFILTQLESIKSQSVPIDEVLIVDDCSTDSTVAICRDFIESNGLLNWRVEINKCNLRPARSFWEAFNRVSGDIIFMSDQDDQWLPNRVKAFVDEFERNPQILSLATTFTRYDDDFKEDHIISEKVKHPFRKNNDLRKISLEEFCRFSAYLGMSCAFRRDLLRKIHHPFDGLTHDVFINFYAALNSGFYYLDVVLTNRRTYSKSVSNATAHDMAKQQFQGKIYMVGISMEKRFLDHFVSYINEEAKLNLNFLVEKSMINKYAKYMAKRFDFLLSHNFCSYTAHTMLMIKLFGIKEVVKDTLYMLNIRY